MRVRHIPTDIAIKCTRERSQAANKTIALELLKVGFEPPETLKPDQRLRGAAVGAIPKVCSA